jgi:Effector-associated domain 11
MTNTPSFITQIRELIAKDDFKTAIQQLSVLLKESPRLDEAVQQSARYTKVMHQIRLGHVDFESATMAQNQIRYGVLELLREIEEAEAEKPEVKSELEKYWQNKTIIQNAEKIYNIGHIDNANFS